jgi:hypothetical protein
MGQHPRKSPIMKKSRGVKLLQNEGVNLNRNRGVKMVRNLQASHIRTVLWNVLIAASGEEVLDAYIFTRLKEAQMMAHPWMWIYNNQRPHQSLSYQPPVVFLQKHQQTETFPTFQYDEEIEWKSLVLNATN